MGVVHFGLLLPVDHAAPRGAWHRLCDTNSHRRLELKVSDVDLAILSFKRACSVTDLRALRESPQAVKVLKRAEHFHVSRYGFRKFVPAELCIALCAVNW